MISSPDNDLLSSALEIAIFDTITLPNYPPSTSKLILASPSTYKNSQFFTDLNNTITKKLEHWSDIYFQTQSKKSTTARLAVGKASSISDLVLERKRRVCEVEEEVGRMRGEVLKVVKEYRKMLDEIVEKGLKFYNEFSGGNAEFEKKFGVYYRVISENSTLKISCIKLEMILSTYSFGTNDLATSKEIKLELQDIKENLEVKLNTVNSTLQQYEIIGDDFLNIVESYSRVTLNIKRLAADIERLTA